MPAEVETERLLLRRWRPEDVAPLAEIYRQPEYLRTMPPADAAEEVRRWEARWTEDGFAHWAACERTNGRLIGRIGLLRHRDWPLEPDPVEVGWVLHRDVWGRGLATEGGRAAIAVWRDHLHDELLYSFTTPSNVRSRAVMERLGLRLGGSTTWRGLEHVWYVLERESPGHEETRLQSPPRSARRPLPLSCACEPSRQLASIGRPTVSASRSVGSSAL